MFVLRQIFVSVVQIFICTVCCAQREQMDSLKKLLVIVKGPQRVNCLNTLSKLITENYYHKPDTASALMYTSQAFYEAEKLNYLQGMGDAKFMAGEARMPYADLAVVEQDLRRAISFFEKCSNTDTLAHAYFELGVSLNAQANLPAALEAFNTAYRLSTKVNSLGRAGYALTMIGLSYGTSGNYEKAFEFGYRALRERENNKDWGGVSWAYINLGRLFSEVEDYPSAIDYFQNIRIKYSEQHKLYWFPVNDLVAIAYWGMHQYDSALFYMRMFVMQAYPDSAAFNKRMEEPGKADFQKEDINLIEGIGLIHFLDNKYDLALRNWLAGFKNMEATSQWAGVMTLLPHISEAYVKKGDYAHAFIYARKLLDLGQKTGAMQRIRDGKKLLWKIYDHEKSVDSAYKYYQQYTAMKDSVGNYRFLSQVTSFKETAANEKKESAYQLNLAKQAFTKKLLIAGIIVIVFFAVITIWNITLKRKNIIRQREILQGELHIQKLEGEKTKAELQKQATELEMQSLRAATQEQLIHSEKMASLGELTSGIAHEIKNPLNFINNFSEINMELISEIEEEQIPNLDESNKAQMASIIKTLKKNSEKINHHGKRVDGIVKGMLQHSQLSNVAKEAVDINALCDESLKLAWHSFKAKEKTFHASFETRFDPELPHVMVFPQDFGRVLINLINNAFYTVHEKKKRNQSESLPQTLQPESLYKPLVIVSTKKNGNKIFITVSDNGMGIPSPIMNKIFQPFFTTKPTGEGTGLGLSMSYDIISKSHGGEIKAKSKEGLGTDFEIMLPVS